MEIELSVVMSVYNTELYLKEAIRSILNQTYKKFEFIIVNDGSTDNSLEIIKSFNDNRIIVFNQENQGLSKALNRGISISNGKYIARMDADDISLPNRFELQLDFLNTHKEYVLIGSNIYYVDINGEILDKSKLPLINEEINESLPNIKFMHSSAMFLKNAFYEAGEYPIEIPKYFEDKILWNKMAKYGKIANLELALVKYRLVPSSIFNLSNSQIQKHKDISNKIIKNNYFLTNDDKLEIIDIAKITKNQQYGNYYLRVAFMHNKNNKRIKSLCFLIKSFIYNPLEMDTLKMFVKVLLPTFLTIQITKRLKGK
jgi:glycosyltransferase involved in cell wall biosynthesis